jgi:F-type H+-transporting ATPase subunit a
MLNAANLLPNLFINSPLEQFEITSLFSFNAPLFGYINFTLTNLGFYTLVVFFLIVSLNLIANNNIKLLPNR